MRFAKALVEARWDDAHRLLAPNMAAEANAEQLHARFEAMIERQAVTSCEVMETLEEWPAKLPGDVGWAYVAIAGTTFSEAVAVVVTRSGRSLRIRSIEWGRP